MRAFGRGSTHQDLGDTPPPVAPAGAWAKVDDLIRAGGDGWKELTDLNRRPAGKRSRSNPGHRNTSASDGTAVWYDWRKARQKLRKRASI
ncbi:hypothetical protein GCM10010169_34870 [Micromonospora fulviviridis]|nr:hypothetical protein GCM10010169_34870 [Micromonospora fulviviridis]